VSPETLLQNEHLELDAEYYISKNLIPPLERIFNLVGANVRQWFDEMPKIQRIRNIALPLNTRTEPGNAGGGGATNLKKTLESYMKSSACLVCRAKLPPTPPHLPGVDISAFALLPLCAKCLKRPARSLFMMKERIWRSEVKAKQVDMICRDCSKLAWGEEIKCDSRDCPVFYTRIRERSKLSELNEGVGKVVEVLEEHDNNDLEGGVVKEKEGSEELAW
jgi:DNA polymerase zeta